MAEVLVQFDEPQQSADGRWFIAQVHGRRMAGGLWEAWIEFLPREGGDPIRTGRETEQFSRGDLRYWAAGLTRVYLEGALARALAPQPTVAQSVSAPPPVKPLRDAEQTVLETTSLVPSVPVLDPFAIHRRSGEYVLRQELRALDAPHLRDIIVAYDIPDIDTTDMARTFEDALAEKIVAGVQQRVVSNPTQSPHPRPQTNAGKQ